VQSLLARAGELGVRVNLSPEAEAVLWRLQWSARVGRALANPVPLSEVAE
jgi:hypothetical protein